MNPARIGQLAAAALIAASSGCGFLDPLGRGGFQIVFAPGDTALYVGATFQARALMRNSYGDEYPSEHIEYRSLDPNVASASPRGVVTGLAFGYAGIVATRGDLADTGWVSVVPTGMLTARQAGEPHHVVVLNTDGSGLLDLANVGYFGGMPAWLPGAGGVVFTDAAGALRVTTLSATSRTVAANGQYPRVSRDGAWVYFWRAGSSGGYGTIWRAPLDSAAEEQVPSVGREFYPDPSPDGTLLVFARRRFPDDGVTELWTRTLAGGAEQLLITGPVLARWAPDGNRLAYWAGNQDASGGAIYVVNRDGSGQRQISQPGRIYYNYGLDWSPDGTWVVANSALSLDLIHVASGLTLPLPFPGLSYPAWRW